MLFSKKVKDPVCGMEIKIKTSTLQTNYKGEVYYFCSADCLTTFQSNPDRFVSNHSKDCCGGGQTEKVAHSNEEGHSHCKNKHHNCNHTHHQY
jgi:P-type Cu+ transporter